MLRGLLGGADHRHHHAHRADVERTGDEVIFAARHAHHRHERRGRGRARTGSSASRSRARCAPCRRARSRRRHCGRSAAGPARRTRRPSRRTRDPPTASVCLDRVVTHGASVCPRDGMWRVSAVNGRTRALARARGSRLRSLARGRSCRRATPSARRSGCPLGVGATRITTSSRKPNQGVVAVASMRPAAASAAAISQPMPLCGVERARECGRRAAPASSSGRMSGYARSAARPRRRSRDRSVGTGAPARSGTSATNARRILRCRS